MNIEYTFKNISTFAQAYGVETYGEQQYSYCETTPEGCVPVNTSQTTAPNTGFFGMSQDAAIASVSGALLVAIAIAGAVYIVLSRRRGMKKKNQE